ncbi:hypothetical protein [Cellulomonas sp. KRMCY2]|uniref:hypothetical protein n=1 Tax=Cellulomonas sp. KRMCY2 TaxID=1304865 RepID=UPI0012DD9061|nr:hypothetical protein [Cellulomonas sp. KRMCY2]
MRKRAATIQTAQADVEDVAQVLGVSEAAVRKRAQRPGDFPEPVTRNPLTWATVDIYAYLLDSLAPTRRPPIPVHFWPRPAVAARLAAVENTDHALELVFQPEQGLGTITLRYRSAYGTPTERSNRRASKSSRAAASDDVVCDMGWEESDDGFFVRVRHPAHPDVTYEVTTPQLAHALGQPVPVIPWPLVHTGALHRWRPGEPSPIKGDVLAQDDADDLRRYRGALPHQSPIDAAVERHWRWAHDQALHEAWRAVDRAKRFADSVILAVEPSEPLPAAPSGSVDDWTHLMLEPVGDSAGTERIASAIDFADAIREVAEIGPGKFSAPQEAFVGRFAAVQPRQAGLAHLILRRYLLGYSASESPASVRFLRHRTLPIAAATLGKRFVFAMPDVFLSSGIDQLDLTDPRVPLYFGDDGEWAPLPGRAGGYHAGYPGAGPSHLTASVKHLLEGGQTGDPDDPFAIGDRPNVFSFPGRAGVWSRRELEALFA